jgi:FMN phosphatase YigB (HAD superfamily)
MFVYFDLGNVLLFFSHRKAAEQLAALGTGTVDEVWQFTFGTDLNWRCDAGRVSAHEFCQIFRERFHSTATDQAIRHASADIFTPNTPMIDTLVGLKRAGYRIGVLSNTCDMHVKWLNEHRRFPPLLDVFDVHIYSYREQLMKPGREIYALAAERAQVEPREVLYVDDLEVNVVGACAAGFDAVQYTSPEAFHADLTRRGLRFN